MFFKEMNAVIKEVLPESEVVRLVPSWKDFTISLFSKDTKLEDLPHEEQMKLLGKKKNLTQRFTGENKKEVFRTYHIFPRAYFLRLPDDVLKSEVIILRNKLIEDISQELTPVEEVKITYINENGNYFDTIDDTNACYMTLLIEVLK